MKRTAHRRLCGVALFVVAMLALTTSVVYSRTANPILMFYWICGACIIGACLVAFVVGRLANRHAGRGDVLWQPGRNSTDAAANEPPAS